MKVWQANIMLFVIAIIWGFGFIATEEAMKFITPMQMQVFRFGIGALILTIFCFKRVKNASRRSIIYGLLIGIVFFIAMSFQNFGLDNTTVPKNAFITITNVVFVPIILYVLYRKKPENYFIYGVIVILIGFFFLLFDINIFDLKASMSSLSSQVNFNVGDFLTLLCAIMFAIYYILCGNYVRDEDPITMLIFQLWISTILSFILSLFVDGNILSIEKSALIDAMPSLIFLAVFSSIISFAMQLIAQKYVPSSNAAIICSLESLFATIFAVILGREAASISLILAAIIITIGVIWAETGFKFGDNKY